MRGLLLTTMILLVGLLSCKKDRLTKEKSVLIGEWEWVYSVRTGQMISPPFATSTDTIFPVDVSSTYGVTFLKKGKVQLYENGILQEEFRTVFEDYENGCWHLNNGYGFQIKLDNDSHNNLYGCGNSDSLEIRHESFPFSNGIIGSYYDIKHYNIFKKVN